MDIFWELSSRFVAPIVDRLGFRLDHDHAYRNWSPTKDVCCVVGLRGGDGRYTASIGFCSPQIIRWFGLEDKSLPTLAECNTCGIIFAMGSLLRMTLQAGWKITDDNDLEIVGVLFRETLETQLPGLLERYMTINGWIGHFRQRVSTQIAGRGVAWSMLGYTLLASESSSLEEIREVLTAHSHEQPSRKLANRVDKHLEIQRSLVFERFGVIV